MDGLLSPGFRRLEKELAVPTVNLLLRHYHDEGFGPYGVISHMVTGTTNWDTHRSARVWYTYASETRALGVSTCSLTSRATASAVA